MVLSKRPLVKNTKSTKNSMQQRSLILFDSAINSPKTRESYIGYLNEFRDFLSSKVMIHSLRLNQKKLREMIENFIISQKNYFVFFCTSFLLDSCLCSLRLFCLDVPPILCPWGNFLVISIHFFPIVILNLCSFFFLILVTSVSSCR